MKTNRITLITLLGIVLLSSCEKEIEFKGDQMNPKLVINSIIEPGKPIDAAISKSYFFLDNQPNTTAPADLMATLYVNGNRIGEMRPDYDTVWTYGSFDDNGNYVPAYYLKPKFTNSYHPAVGDVVKITASANGFDDVEAVASPLPSDLAFSIVDSKISDWSSFYSSAWYNETDNDSILHVSMKLELTIEITDPNPKQTNYFRLNVNEGSRENDLGNYVSCYTEYNDPVFGSVAAENEYFDISDLNMAPENVFTDVLFDGRSYQIKMPFTVALNIMEDDDPDFFRIEIFIEHLSKEYYNYLYTSNQNDEVMQLLAEPVQTYSNVQGGYGIVAGNNSDTVMFALPHTEIIP